MGKNISGNKLYMLVQKEQLLRSGFSKDLLEECLEKWRSWRRKLTMNRRKKAIFEKFDVDGGSQEECS